MPAPTTYSDATMAQFVVDTLGAAGVALGLTVASAQVVGVVYAVERLLGVAVASQTDMAKLETIATWLAWRAAKGAAVGQYDLSADGSALKRSQLFDHVASMLAEAEAAALVYSEVQAALSGGSMAYVTGSSGVGSPYGWAPADEWA